MAKISTYSVVNPEGDDKIIISEANGNPSNVTKNVTVDGLKTFIVNGLPVPTLQEVTTSGNTTTKNITTQETFDTVTIKDLRPITTVPRMGK